MMARELLVPLRLMVEPLSRKVSPLLRVRSAVIQKEFNRLVAISGISMTPQLMVQLLRPTPQQF